ALHLVEAEEGLGLLGSELPDAERGPDVDLLVGGRGPGVALLVEILPRRAEALAPVAEQSLRGRAVRARWTLAVIEDTLDVDPRVLVVDCQEAARLVLVGLGAVARVVRELAAVAQPLHG